MSAWTDKINASLERYLPEKRLFLRSDTSTRFVRLRPLAQATILSVVGVYFAWSLLATSILFFEMFGSADLREAARREQSYFETRLSELAEQRDQSVAEARQAHQRYSEAMDRVATMQTLIINAEERNAELERGLNAVQTTMRTVLEERDSARSRLAELEAGDANSALAQTTQHLAEVEQTLDFLMAALSETTQEREGLRDLFETTSREMEHLALEYRLIQDRNARIFSQLEEAVQVSMEPLDRMFRAAGVQPEQILRQVRSGYQTRSASLQPISISTSGTLDPNSDEARANGVLQALSDIDVYRQALERTPFASPVSHIHVTSPFGMRRHPVRGGYRMHTGVDLAGTRRQRISSTADGVVQFAGRQGGYGNIVIIRHDFGLVTRYAHLHSINVRTGQRVSRGDRIGGMGNTGQSTGVHLHYEIRVGDRPINPMTYIRAAQNVF